MNLAGLPCTPAVPYGIFHGLGKQYLNTCLFVLIPEADY